MLVLAGTIPIQGLPLLAGQGVLTPEGLVINDHVLDKNRGTAAMMTTVAVVCKKYGLRPPLCVVAGDTGKRDGSSKVYAYLTEHLEELHPEVMAFHYIMPDIVRNNRLVKAIKRLERKPLLIADAGSMYVAKAGGHAPYYDIFTPDMGELAFLADEKADHPAYTRGFIWHMNQEVHELVHRAYHWKNAANILFVKGSTDYICRSGQVLTSISQPSVPELEAIGGTGDTITGMLTALAYRGGDLIEACMIAARANREAGSLAKPTPATQVDKIIECIPQALHKAETSLVESLMEGASRVQDSSAMVANGENIVTH
ncbi:MAG: NAD(P)H-hydrate dehydratase [bacterium]